MQPNGDRRQSEVNPCRKTTSRSSATISSAIGYGGSQRPDANDRYRPRPGLLPLSKTVVRVVQISAHGCRNVRSLGQIPLPSSLLTKLSWASGIPQKADQVCAPALVVSKHERGVAQRAGLYFL